MSKNEEKSSKINPIRKLNFYALVVTDKESENWKNFLWGTHPPGLVKKIPHCF